MIYAMGRNHEEFVAQTVADLALLPKSVEMGCVCIVIETTDVYMFDGKEWKLL